MKSFLPIAVSTGAAALLVSFWFVQPGPSRPARTDDPVDASRICQREPSWFAPIHEYYDCNPRITPDFDFASLYSGVLPEPSGSATTKPDPLVPQEPTQSRSR